MRELFRDRSKISISRPRTVVRLLNLTDMEVLAVSSMECTDRQ